VSTETTPENASELERERTIFSVDVSISPE